MVETRYNLLAPWICDLCGDRLEAGYDSLDHYSSSCNQSLEKLSKDQPQDPFIAWKLGLAEDRSFSLEESAKTFSLAGELFVSCALTAQAIARSYYEYSTLMLAYASVQQGRQMKRQGRLSESLDAFTKACEVFRASVHFAFLAPFVSACAILEDIESTSHEEEIDRIESFRNANALFAQSQMALSFADDQNPIVNLADAYVRLGTSRALREELVPGHNQSSSILAYKDYQRLVVESGISPFRDFINYLPCDHYARVKSAFLVAYPEGDKFLLQNIGANDAILKKVGDVGLDDKVKSGESFGSDASKLKKGRIRISYKDDATGIEYDEGCAFLI